MNVHPSFRTDTPQKRLIIYKNCLRWVKKRNPENYNSISGLCNYFTNINKLFLVYPEPEDFKEYLPELYSTFLPGHTLMYWKGALNRLEGIQARIKALEKAIEITKQSINNQ